MRRALALLAFTLAGPLAAAEAPAIIDRMIEAARTLNFRGHVVQIEGTQAQTLVLLHRAGREAGEDRAHSLQGAYWELRRAGPYCKVAMTSARLAHDDAIVAAAFPSLVPQRLARLAQFYDFAPIGSGRFADRPADFTLAKPLDAFRFAYLLVTDSATGLLLKTGLVDHRGQILRQVFFVDLQVLPRVTDAEWLRPTPGAPAPLNWTERTVTPEPVVAELPWPVGGLPPGFSVSGHTRRRMPGGEHEVEQITLSDGLATVSVFIDPQAAAENAADTASSGARHVADMPVFGTVVDGRQVTVLGAAPFPALRQIAAALTTSPAETTSVAPNPHPEP
ncbi:MAG: MucB/RseB C-terminal domain-containing protein [Pseudomonadota bacterium]